MTSADQLKQYWNARSRKERFLLWVAGAALLAALLYLVLLEPGLAARKQLAAALPRMRAQAEDMQQQQKEIVLLRKKLGAVSQRADLKALLQSSVALTSFVNALERLDAVSGDKALMLAAPVVFDDWLAWTENLQREFGIRLDTCRISALDQAGMVRIEATFVTGQSAAPNTP